jgi:hypothetical protein
VIVVRDEPGDSGTPELIVSDIVSTGGGVRVLSGDDLPDPYGAAGTQRARDYTRAIPPPGRTSLMVMVMVVMVDEGDGGAPLR